MIRNFRNFEIWREGILLTKQIYLVVRKLPKNELYGLQDQLKRAAVSVPSNIAEGSSRNSDKEFKRFLEISMGSLFEIETQLIIVRDLHLIDILDMENIFLQINKEQRKINSFINRLKKNIEIVYCKQLTANS